MFNWQRLIEGILTGGISEISNLATGSSSISEQWDKFKNGRANEINEQQAEKEREFNKEENEKARELENELTEKNNQTNKDIQESVNQTNIDLNQQTNDMNLAIARETNDLNKAIADQNLGFQRETLDYQKALQQQIFEREDTSYQRTAQDMAKAGLNPLTMSGTNVSGGVVSTSAPQSTMQYQGATMNPAQVQGYQNQKSDAAKFIAQYSKFNALSGGIMDVFNTLSGVTNSMDKLMSGSAQRDLLAQNVEGAKIDNGLKLQNAGYASPFLEGKNFYFPTNSDGTVASPYEFTGWNNPKEWYDPANKYLNEKLPQLRQNQHDIKFKLFNNSTDFERNITSINKLANNGMLEMTAENIGKAAKDLIGSFMTFLNGSYHPWHN